MIRTKVFFLLIFDCIVYSFDILSYLSGIRDNHQYFVRLAGTLALQWTRSDTSRWRVSVLTSRGRLGEPSLPEAGIRPRPTFYL